MLSLLSQDDYTKIKDVIHTHIDKIGDKIEEIAASEEEEDGATGRELGNIIETEQHDDDDEQVILTSVRDYEKKGTSNREGGNFEASGNNIEGN